MAPNARDLMQSHVISVDPDTPLLDVDRLFVEEEIHGAPVVDETGKVLGVITTHDLLRAVQEEHDSAASGVVYYREDLEFSTPGWAHRSGDFQDRLRELRAGDFMREEVVAVGPGAGVPEVARTLRQNRVHRVLVLEEGRLVGIISITDLLSLLEKSSPGG
jgi:CBS domain-containing protein